MAKKSNVWRPWLWRRWRPAEVIAIAVLALTPVVLQFFDFSFFVVLTSSILSLAGIALVIFLGGEWGLVGPHFFYDVIRLARRGRSTAVRVLFVGALLFGLGYVYGGRFWHRDFIQFLFDPGVRLSRNELASLAEGYVFTIILLQNLAVLILTPAYVASGVAEERERRTLQLLFTSHLYDHEIVLGKLGARIVHMAGVLLAALPVLSLSQLLGGVDMVVLLANFFNTLLNVTTVGSVCILVSVLSRTVFGAVMTSYGIVLPFALCFSCFSANVVSSPLVLWQADFSGGYPHLFEMLVALVMVHGLVSGFCLAIAISNLRAPLESDVVLPRPTAVDPYLVRSREPVELQIVKREPLKPLPVMDDRPLLWKEMYLGAPILVFSPAFWVPMGSLLLPLMVMFLLVLLDMERSGSGPLEGFNVLIRMVLVLIAALFCLGVGYRACGSVVREKEQGTLDALLTLPVGRRDILAAKWLGALYRGWGWAIFYVPILLFGLVTGILHPLGVLFLLVAPLVHAVFLASLGLLLSITSKTVLVAQLRLGLGVVILLGIGLLGALALNDVEIFRTSLNPVACWYNLGFPLWERMERWEPLVRVSSIVPGLVFYGVAAWALWLFACAKFHPRESGDKD